MTVEIPRLLYAVMAVAAGAVLGSFFNVVIHRIPKDLSVIHPPSHCPSCAMPIRWWDNIPVLSWFFLRGRCRQCGTRISLQYPAVELATGLLAAGLFYNPFNLPLETYAGLCYIALVSIPLVIIDSRHYIIPDLLVFPGVILALGVSLVPGGIAPWQSLLGLLLPALVLWGLGFGFEKILEKEAIGWGDIKLLGLIGSFFGVVQAFNSLFIAAILGIAAVLFLAALNRGWRVGQRISFGPYLCAGSMLSIWVHFPIF